MTRRQLADLMGVSYQLIYSYERGGSRIAASRLHAIAHVLGVDVSYFFEELHDTEPFQATEQQRMLLDLARNFLRIPTHEHQEALCSIARTLAETERRERGPRKTAC